MRFAGVEVEKDKVTERKANDGQSREGNVPAEEKPGDSAHAL